MKALNIRGRLSLLFLAFALLVVVSAGTTFWTIHAMREDAVTVNLAGRQRMLTQQMTRLARQLEHLPADPSRLALQETMAAYEQALLALREGGSVSYYGEIITNLPITHDADVRVRLERLTGLWNDFRGDLLVALASEPNSQEFQQAVSAVESASPQLVEQADMLARAYSNISAQKVERLRWIQIAFLSSALVLLALGGWMTYRSLLEPMKRLDAAAQRIGSGDLSTPVQVTGPQEIQVLSDTLEGTRVQLKNSLEGLQEWADTLEQRVSQRSLELEALYTVMREISSHLEIEHVLCTITEKARQLLGGDLAYLCMLDEDGQILNLQATSGPQEAVETTSTRASALLPGQILSGKRAIQCSIEGCQGYCEIMALPFRTSHIAVALQTGRRVIGALCVGSSQADFFSEDDLDLLTELSNAAAVALENARLYAQAERSAMLEERQRLAGEMHDGLAQTLSYLQMTADRVYTQLKAGNTGLALSTLERCNQAIDQASQEARRAIESLQEETPRYYPLQEQLRELVDGFCQGDTRIAWMTNLKSPLLLTPEQAEQILRVVSEAVTNACNHSQAMQIRVCLELEGENGIVQVSDDGVGFDPQKLPKENGRKHFGLSIMRARAARLGGQLTIQSSPGVGTSIRLSWPLSADDLSRAGDVSHAREAAQRRPA